MKSGGLAAELLAQLLDGTQLSRSLCQTGGSGAVVELRALLVQRLLSGLEGLLSSGFVQVTGADHGVGQDLHHARLHFEETTGDVEHLLLAALLDQADRTRLEIGDQRGVARRDTQVAQVAVGDHHLDQTGEDLRFGADDVAVDSNSHTLASRKRPLPGARITASSLSRWLLRCRRPC